MAHLPYFVLDGASCSKNDVLTDRARVEINRLVLELPLEFGRGTEKCCLSHGSDPCLALFKVV